MIAGPDRRRNVGDAIFADEIGIEYGVYGEFRLRSAYQRIFAPRGRFLKAVAVEGLVEPHRAGRPVAPRAFFEGVPAGSFVRRSDVPGAAFAELPQHRRRWARPVLQLQSADQRSSRAGAAEIRLMTSI
jgi:hypothetical protein